MEGAFWKDDCAGVAAAAESVLVFENAALGLLVLDETGHIVMANEAARQMLGYDLGELDGMDAVAMMVAPTRTWRERVEAGARTPDHSITLLCKDQSEINVRVSSLVVRGSSGNVRYAVSKIVEETVV